MPQCSSCHAPIIWAVTEATGRNIPINANPDHVNGNVELMPPPAEGLHMPIARVHAQPPMLPEYPLHTSHFATCLYADRHRKPKPPRRR